MRKGEIACNKQFLLFSQCFLPVYGTYFLFYMHFKMSSAICFNLDQSKMSSSGNGLMNSSFSPQDSISYTPLQREMYFGYSFTYYSNCGLF